MLVGHSFSCTVGRSMPLLSDRQSVLVLSLRQEETTVLSWCALAFSERQSQVIFLSHTLLIAFLVPEVNLNLMTINVLTYMEVNTAQANPNMLSYHNRH